MINKRILFLITIMFVFSKVCADPPNWQPIQCTPYSMVLMAQITLYTELFEGIGNNVAAAFGPAHCDTINDCRSVATWQLPNPPYWNGFWHFVIVSNDTTGVINFKIYNGETDMIYDCNETIIFTDNETLGNPSNPYMLTSYLTDVNVSNIPPVFQLSQNSPNPFNATTSISYSLAKSSDVKLQIYNVKGQLIQTLVDGYKTVGNHPVVWNAENLSSGIYFYKIKAGVFTEIRRCLILK